MRHRRRPAEMKRFPRPPRRPFNACFPILRPCVSKTLAKSRRRLTGNFPRRGNACECSAAPFCKPPILSALRPSSPERRGRLSRFLSGHENFSKRFLSFFLLLHGEGRKTEIDRADAPRQNAPPHRRRAPFSPSRRKVRCFFCGQRKTTAAAAEERMRCAVPHGTARPVLCLYESRIHGGSVLTNRKKLITITGKGGGCHGPS